MPKPAFQKPGSLESFSVACLFASSVARDWSEGYPEQWEIALPAFTLRDIAEHAADLLDAKAANKAKANPYAPAPKALADAFQQSDGYDSFRDGFEPMMSYAWPVELAYEVSVEDAVRQMAIFAPSCSLVERVEPGEEPSYEIALNGGGMNLADHIAAAYLCCGCLPPVNILDQLSGACPSYLLPLLPMAEVYAEAQAFLRLKAERLGDELAKIARYQAEQRVA